MTVFALSHFTLVVRNSGPFKKQLGAYFSCEQNGHDTSDPCDRGIYRQLTYPKMTAVAFILLGLFPAVNLVYALNVKELKDNLKCAFCCSVKKSRNASVSTATTNASSTV